MTGDKVTSVCQLLLWTLITLRVLILSSLLVSPGFVFRVIDLLVYP